MGCGDIDFPNRFLKLRGVCCVQETIHGHLKIASKLADSGYARVAGIEMARMDKLRV